MPWLPGALLGGAVGSAEVGEHATGRKGETGAKSKGHRELE